MVDVEIVMDLAAMAALPASGLLSCFFFAMAAAMVPASVATAAVAVATITASGLLFYSSSSVAMAVATTAVAADANICLTDAERGLPNGSPLLRIIP